MKMSASMQSCSWHHGLVGGAAAAAAGGVMPRRDDGGVCVISDSAMFLARSSTLDVDIPAVVDCEFSSIFVTASRPSSREDELSSSRSCPLASDRTLASVSVREVEGGVGTVDGGRERGSGRGKEGGNEAVEVDIVGGGEEGGEEVAEEGGETVGVCVERRGRWRGRLGGGVTGVWFLGGGVRKAARLEGRRDLYGDFMCVGGD